MKKTEIKLKKVLENSLILISAPPNGGKDTQYGFLTTLLESLHQPFNFLGLGDFIRSLGVENFTFQKTKEQMSAGKLLDDVIANSIAWNFLFKNFKKGNIVLMNGYPRNPNQSKEILKQIDFFEFSRKILIKIEVEEKELDKRRKKREKISHRTDDSKKSNKERLGIYYSNEEAIINVLELEFTILKIDGNGTPKQVHQRIKDALTDLTKFTF